MDNNKIYVNFEDWFDECESFDLRSDRFFNYLYCLNVDKRERYIREWMKVAWEQGQQSMLWQNA
jgi:hypothetical protein